MTINATRNGKLVAFTFAEKAGLWRWSNDIDGDSVFWFESKREAIEDAIKSCADDHDKTGDVWNVAFLKAELSLIPKEITRDRYLEMLEMLPPCQWYRGEWDRCESFKFLERWSANMTSVFAQVWTVEGLRWFEFVGDCNTPHADIMALCKVSVGIDPTPMTMEQVFMANRARKAQMEAAANA